MESLNLNSLVVDDKGRVSFSGLSTGIDFRAAVDDYLETCKKLERKPEREYSGQIPLRIDPTTHREARTGSRRSPSRNRTCNVPPVSERSGRGGRSN